MKKYLFVIKNTWNEILTYRLSFSMWRFRTVLWFLMGYFLWNAIMPTTGNLFGYSRNLMLTYILVASFMSAIVSSSRTSEVGENINSGNLSIFLLKPFSYFKYWFSRDIGDKLMNISFALLELTILFLLLKPPIFIQTNLFILLLTVLAVGLAILLNFFIGMILSMIAFWSPEVWGPRFIFYILVSYFGGSFFPLDILPTQLFNIFRLLPFTYLYYFPTKIYLGNISFSEILIGFAISTAWCFLLYLVTSMVWKKGLRIYEAYGR